MGHCNPKGTNMEKQVIFLLLTTSFACGKASTLDDRIIGGTNATIEEFPYQVDLDQAIGKFEGEKCASLQVRNASGEAPLYKHLCGAAVIGRNWLVSAAHCIQSRYASKLVVRAGTTNRYEGGSLHHVVNVIKHPDYDVEIDYDCDISLLKVKEPFVYSTRIQPILLPEADSDVACGTLATVAGWGNSELQEGDAARDRLRQVSVPVVSEAECRAVYGEDFVTDNMLCAGCEWGGKDACLGDSGGPLAAAGKQIGVVSWGEGCARPGLPGVYARVAVFRRWITDNTGV